MVGLTREAVRAIRELTEPETVDGIRIHAGTRRFTHDKTPSIQIDLVGAPDVEDLVLEAEGARLFVDSETMAVLDDKIVHADLSGDEPRFVIIQAEPARV